MELILILMIIHSPIHCSWYLLSQILRSMFQILHTLCIPLSLMVRNPVTFRMFSQPYQVLLVSFYLPYLITCFFTSPHVFLESIPKASLKISFFSPIILLLEMIHYQSIPMILLICLYVFFWTPWKLNQPMDPMHSHSLIL